MAADARDVEASLEEVRGHYEGLKRRTAAVHEAKIAVKRAAASRARRGGAANTAELEAEVAAAERLRDEALRDLDIEMETEIETTKREMSEDEAATAARREAIERHLEAERARAKEASAGIKAPPPLRTQVGAEEADKYEDADDYRTSSPRGTSPRAADEDGIDGPREPNAFRRVKEAVVIRRSSGSAHDVESTAKAANSVQENKSPENTTVQKSARVNMASLAPKPVEISTVVQKQTPPDAGGAPTNALDPHADLVRRLKSSRISRDNVSTPAPASNVVAVKDEAQPKMHDAFSQPSPRKATIHAREPFAPPRGLGAAISALKTSRSGTQEVSQDMESAFGAPQATHNVRATQVPALLQEPRRMNVDVFAPDTAVPAAPVHVEPNPYIISTQHSPRKRVGVPKPNQPVAPALPQPLSPALQQPLSPALQPSLPPPPEPVQRAANKLEEPPSRAEDLVLAPSNQLATHAAPITDSFPNELKVKPKMARVLAPDFKVSEIRNLFSYARHGRYSELKRLLSKGVPVDARDEMGNTPLTVAGQNGQGRCVKLLIRHGADPNAQNKRGNTPLHYTLHFRFDQISDFIQRHGGETDIQNYQGETCYEYVG